MIFGTFLLIFGIIFLLNNLGFITSGVWDTFWAIFWPSVIIFMAINILIPKKRWRSRTRRMCRWCPFGESSKEKAEETQEKE